MKPFQTALAAFWVAISVTSADAQLPQTRLYAVFPLGGQVGSTFDVAVTNGADLDEIDKLLFSDPGIKAVAKMQESNGVSTPVANTFTVTIDSGVKPGFYEVCTGGLFGVSNPRAFAVGQRKESQETEANNAPDQATVMELNSTVNARSNGGADIDYFKFAGKKGQRVVLACEAAKIDSRMRATLELYASNGRTRLGYGTNEHGDDPLVDATLPEDGDYLVKVYDFVYGGSNDHGYRLDVHTGPHIDFVLPPSGLPNSTGTYTLFGRNLPGGADAGVSIRGSQLQKLDVQIALPGDSTTLQPGANLRPTSSGLDGVSYVLQTPQGNSNPVTIFLATAPVVVEVEPNNAQQQAQKVTVPCEFDGQFQQRGDVDFVEFEAKAGENYWLEVFAHRNGTSADPYLMLDQVLLDKDGKETGVKRITVQDDNPANPFPNHFDTLTDDPVFKFTVPADGKYRVSLRDRYFEARGDQRLIYRLSIHHEMHDYRLAVVPVAPTNGQNNSAAAPWPIGLRKGDNFAAKVVAFRRDGFDGAIDVTAEGLPEGVTCKGATIGPGQNLTTLVFSAADNAPESFARIRVLAQSRIDDPVKVKDVLNAEATLKAAKESVPKAQDEVTKATGPFQKAETDKSAAEQKAKADAETAKTAADAKVVADKAAVDTAAAAKTAADAKTTAEQKAAADTQAGKVAADKSAAAKQALDKEPDKQELKDAFAAAQKAADEAAEAAKKSAEAKVAADKNAADTTAAAQKSAQEKQQADKLTVDTAAVAKTSDGALQKVVAAFQQAETKLKATQDAKLAADKQVAATADSLNQAKAAKVAAARDVARAARTGTILWPGNQTQPGVGRVSRELGLCVMKETAPFQATTDVFRVDANRGRQILIPVKLAKRNNYDENVTLTFIDVPKNAQAENKPINKGKNEELLKVTIPTNVQPGVYTLYLQTQGQVAYSRNPARVERAKAGQSKADEEVKASAELLKQANAARDAAVKQAAADAQAVPKAAAAKDASAKKAADTAAAAKAAEEQKATADKAAADADAASKAAADNADLKKKAEETAKAAADAAKKLADAQAAAKQAADELAVADKTLATAQETSKASEEAKTKAEAQAKDADAKSKSAATAKQAADKEVTDATNAAKPQNVNVFPPSTPIVINVKTEPATLAAAVPDGGKIAKGGKIEVKVTVNRANGFDGPVTLTLPLPPGVTGLSAEPVTIPADQKEGVFAIQAAGDATEGQLPHMVVRATMDFDGPAAVDQPITLNVSK